ncbi:MAG: hypothetical protein ABI134_36090 [Byssovorax sp.]
MRLVATLGSSTGRVGSGVIRLSFNQEPGVLFVMCKESKCELVVKWDVALRFMALVHLLVLQNRLLRDEAPEIRHVSERTRIFDVTGGLRMSAIVCSWDASTADVECRPVHEGIAEQFELVVREEAAAELVMSLAERMALNGTTMAGKSSGL